MIRHLHEANMCSTSVFFGSCVSRPRVFKGSIYMERAPILPYLMVVANKTFIYITITSHHQNLLIQLNHLNLRPWVKPLRSVENEGVVKWCEIHQCSAKATTSGQVQVSAVESHQPKEYHEAWDCESSENHGRPPGRGQTFSKKPVRKNPSLGPPTCHGSTFFLTEKMMKHVQRKF